MIDSSASKEILSSPSKPFVSAFANTMENSIVLLLLEVMLDLRLSCKQTATLEVYNIEVGEEDVPVVELAFHI